MIITQDGGAPFDIGTIRRIDYNATKLSDLENKLEGALRSVSARYPYEGQEPKF